MEWQTGTGKNDATGFILATIGGALSLRPGDSR
jgi:hypothetical protein